MAQNKSTAELREAFLKYFESQGHTRVSSSSVIPSNDPTLLFTNAGMVQFKDCFLGADKRAYSRATSVQKCIRAGGKHNDLENVGFTARHHTFFEMLGNFSFGDYFKKEAIHYAWEFVTKTLGLPKDRLRVSVYVDDDESADIWHKQEGLPRDRIVRFKEDNFWAMGDTGPCGPCTEIFWDQGQDVDGDRWLEFWNCVFMQYDRSADGKLTPLPKPAVDTGMGLERTSAILQGAPSNYDIDLMKGLIAQTHSLVEKRTGRSLKVNPGSWEQSALRVIVDHLRSTSFLLADGVMPSNEGRGYVLRRILRRAVRFGKRLGLEEPFLSDLYPSLLAAMSSVYPELQSRKTQVTESLEREESRFFETLEKGLELLEHDFSSLDSSKKLSAQTIFKLYDTYGFPVDLTALIARERGVAIDESGFDKLMSEQQKRSRASWKGSGDASLPVKVKEWKSRGIAQRFVGYEAHESDSTIVAVEPVSEGAWIAIDPCPFYAESGGQVGDVGILKLGSQSFEVLDTQRPYDGGYALFVRNAQTLGVGQKVQAVASFETRRLTRCNHSATHLLHAALRSILGTHVEQKGSLVSPERLRFDFSHPKPVSKEEIERIEDWVNRGIAQQESLLVSQKSYDEAVREGAMALFGEKYGDRVRVVQMPGLSTELCGGLHVQNTAEIRLFKIVSESAVAAGVRRIEALSSDLAIEDFKTKESWIKSMSEQLKVVPAQVPERLTKLLETNRDLEKQILDLKKKLASGASSAVVLTGSLRDLKLKVHAFEDADSEFLKQKGDQLRQTESEFLHVLLSGHSVLVVADNKKNPKAHAGQVLKELTQALGGRGGGQPHLAQGQLNPDPGLPKKVVEWAGSLR